LGIQPDLILQLIRKLTLQAGLTKSGVTSLALPTGLALPEAFLLAGGQRFESVAQTSCGCKG
jgi:hypothetical protein